MADEHLRHVPVLTARVEALTERRLDLLNASYLNLHDRVGRYEVFIVDAAHEYRIEKIAHRFYRDKNKWRYIALFNGIVLPLVDLYAGRELLIPDITEIERHLQTPSTQQTAPVIVEI